MSDTNTTTDEVLAARVWSGTKWHYPNIEKLRERLSTLERELERERKPWTYKLVTPPTPEGASREGYPDLSEDYELGIRDTGHSDRILLLSSPDLDERINDLQRKLAQAKQNDAISDNAYAELVRIAFKYENQLTAANATIAACKAAGFIDADGRVRKRWYATHVCDARCQGEDGHHTWPPHDPSAAAKEAQ